MIYAIFSFNAFCKEKDNISELEVILQLEKKGALTEKSYDFKNCNFKIYSSQNSIVKIEKLTNEMQKVYFEKLKNTESINSISYSLYDGKPIFILNDNDANLFFELLRHYSFKEFVTNEINYFSEKGLIIKSKASPVNHRSRINQKISLLKFYSGKKLILTLKYLPISENPYQFVTGECDSLVFLTFH